MNSKTTGKEIRHAYDGPDIEHDKLIDQIEARNREDSERASSAGESRQKIGEFLEQTGMNNKALSVLRGIVKTGDKSQDKAMDQIRSLEVGLPMVKNHIAGQGTGEMDLEGPQEEPETAEEPEGQPEPETTDEETEEFNSEVDKVMGDDVVTPIDFGGAAAE